MRIWNLADELFPAATQIVDLHHARELATLATRLLRGSQPDWLARRLAELDAGDIPGLLTAGRSLRFTGSLASQRHKALGYFEASAHRRRYRHFRAPGMFTGSGTVEAGCKHVIGQRLAGDITGEAVRQAADDARDRRNVPGSQRADSEHDIIVRLLDPAAGPVPLNSPGGRPATTRLPSGASRHAVHSITPCHGAHCRRSGRQHGSPERLGVAAPERLICVAGTTWQHALMR
ncbi:MAG: hypothetical protein ACLQDY_10975 [Streptosporangiaceae bacterium]